MSAATAETIGISSTEEVLMGLQGVVMAKAEAFMSLPVDEGSTPAYHRFFAGDNAVAAARRTPGRLSVYFANMTARHSEYSVDEPIELEVGFADINGQLTPLSLTEPGGIKLAINSPDLTEPLKQHRYTPKFWPHDGGYSLETAPEAPSLDQDSIYQIAAFTSRVVEMKLVPYKQPPAN